MLDKNSKRLPIIYDGITGSALIHGDVACSCLYLVYQILLTSQGKVLDPLSSGWVWDEGIYVAQKEKGGGTWASM